MDEYAIKKMFEHRLGIAVIRARRVLAMVKLTKVPHDFAFQKLLLAEAAVREQIEDRFRAEALTVRADCLGTCLFIMML